MIYPMNTLATDQARRFASLVANTPACSGLRVGLYVGGNAGEPGQGMVMTATDVITNRDTLRKNPPDILLSNYKMLDYLLLRPKDRNATKNNNSLAAPQPLNAVPAYWALTSLQFKRLPTNSVLQFCFFWGGTSPCDNDR